VTPRNVRWLLALSLTVLLIAALVGSLIRQQVLHNPAADLAGDDDAKREEAEKYYRAKASTWTSDDLGTTQPTATTSPASGGRTR
jgi:hypothetical protein